MHRTSTHSTAKRPATVTKLIATAALAVGLGAGSYGIANAASGSTTTTTTTPSTAPRRPRRARRSPGATSGATRRRSRATRWRRSRRSPTREVPGGTVVRVETDADGNATYEAHMTKSDGKPVTVYVDSSFNFVSVETR